MGVGDPIRAVSRMSDHMATKRPDRFHNVYLFPFGGDAKIPAAMRQLLDQACDEMWAAAERPVLVELRVMDVYLLASSIGTLLGRLQGDDEYRRQLLMVSVALGKALAQLGGANAQLAKYVFGKE
jgi:hypothetical protein